MWRTLSVFICRTCVCSMRTGPWRPPPSPGSVAAAADSPQERRRRSAERSFTDTPHLQQETPVQIGTSCPLQSGLPVWVSRVKQEPGLCDPLQVRPSADRSSSTPGLL
ncbi:hypothetical protein OJAV_G00143330 [Oryzias javanicus]|uniref:Uncharacterized protein n=1 Tax=Oryzias javanicus TaxID=123683 RepID=A0A437CQ86_ORYJA|nr:hypothetical protein OJAV_G00143330 [Oryzias javanicus]